MTELRPWTWPWLLATTLARGVLATVICLGLWGALPALIGWQPTTVSSGSMLPRLHVGDVAVSRPLRGTPPPLGSVLLFDDPDHPDRLRLHRFVRIGDDGLLVTRGDANPGDDSSPVALSAVRGIGTLRVPWVALPVVWLREGAWLPLGAALLALLGLTAVTAQSRRFGFPEPDAGDEQDPPTGGAVPADLGAGTAAPEGQPVAARLTRQSTGPRRAPVVRGGVLLVAGLLGLVLATPAGAAFTDTTASTSRAAAATYFRCAGAVAASNPYFWYRMDETSSTTTTATDSSTSGRTGVYGSTGKTSVATPACARDSGRTMTFNGTSGYLSSPFYSGTLPNTFTLGIWFRTTTTRGGKLIGWGSEQRNASAVYDRHLYLTNAGRVSFGLYPGATEVVTSPAAYNDGDWHHAMATLSSAGMRLYLDGALVGSDATVTAGEPRTGGYLRVAYDNLDSWPGTPTSRYLAATLDDAALYLTALTPAQVAAQYEAGV